MLEGSVGNCAFLALLYKDMAWLQEEVWDESPRSVREGNDKLVPVLFVQCFFYGWHVCLDGGVIYCSPVLECVLMANVCIYEDVTSHCHDAHVLLHQDFGDAVLHQCCCPRLGVPVGSYVNLPMNLITIKMLRL